MNKPKKLSNCQSHSPLGVNLDYNIGWNKGIEEMEKYYKQFFKDLPELIKKILWDIGEYNDAGEYVIGKGDTQPFIDKLAKRIRGEE